MSRSARSGFSCVEIDAMLAAAPTRCWRAFIAVCSRCGLSPREAIWLAWQDIDFDHAAIMVVSNTISAEDGAYEVPRPYWPWSRQRVVPLQACVRGTSIAPRWPGNRSARVRAGLAPRRRLAPSQHAAPHPHRATRPGAARWLPHGAEPGPTRTRKKTRCAARGYRLAHPTAGRSDTDLVAATTTHWCGRGSTTERNITQLHPLQHHAAQARWRLEGSAGSPSHGQ